MVETIVKRDNSIISFNPKKIEIAIQKAFKEIYNNVTNDAIASSKSIALKIQNLDKNKLTVEEIQNMVEIELMKISEYEVARAYIRFRYTRELARATSFDNTILEIVDCKNDYFKNENSNKNPRLNTTIRDYIAGAVSTNISRRILLPKDIVEAHDSGILHFHDIDYAVQHMTNCCLVNLKDMLQNGTVISETFIEKPHSFSTACNIATQIIAQVASSQYGGQSISLAHLAPFVNVSREVIRKEVKREISLISNNRINEKELIDHIVEERLAKEIKKGIQTIQYQIMTLMTTNGQAPFITLFMYINEAENQREKDDLVLLIEEVLKQSLQGVKNEEGVWITPAFPKIIYVLQEDNITEESKYWYLTKLAAQCSLKRLTPDYISEKVMKKIKNGYCFPVMG